MSRALFGRVVGGGWRRVSGWVERWAVEGCGGGCCLWMGSMVEGRGRLREVAGMSWMGAGAGGFGYLNGCVEGLRGVSAKGTVWIGSGSGGTDWGGDWCRGG